MTSPTTILMFNDYYQLLDIPPSATQEQIRQAYKRESLKTHPDRLVNASPVEKQRATARFQAIADAYYTLSDPKRRQEYDDLCASHPSNDRTNVPNYTGDASGAAEQPDPNGIFADVFAELLRPEVERRAPWWSYLGAVCGAGMGFIVANVPGLMVGAYAGNRLGAVRDAKGKSVAVVFNELGGNQKAEILRALAMKVLGSVL